MVELSLQIVGTSLCHKTRVLEMTKDGMSSIPGSYRSMSRQPFCLEHTSDSL